MVIEFDVLIILGKDSELCMSAEDMYVLDVGHSTTKPSYVWLTTEDMEKPLAVPQGSFGDVVASKDLGI